MLPDKRENGMIINTTTDVRVANTINVYSTLRSHGALTRRQLTSIVDLTFASVSSICNDLLKEGMIHQDDRTFATGGRNAQRLSFVSDFAYAVVLDMHHTEYVMMALADLSNTVVKTVRRSIAEVRTLEDLLDVIKECYDELVHNFDNKIYCISVGVSAVYRHEHEILLQSSNPLLERVNLAMHLRQIFPHLPILIENDANLAAYGQLPMIPNSTNNHLFLLFTQGIGLGLIVDGKLYQGSHGFAGELGHLKVTGVELVCSKCGNVGCMLTVVPLTTIARDLNESNLLKEVGSLAYSDHLLERAKTEPVVRERILFSAEKIGEILAELFDIINPQRILLGGNNWKLYPMMSQVVRQTCRTLSNLAREVDLEIQFVEEPINSLICRGAAEYAFYYFTRTSIPDPILFTP